MNPEEVTTPLEPQFDSCSTCGCVVLPSMRDKHRNWHETVEDIGRTEGHNGGYYPVPPHTHQTTY